MDTTTSPQSLGSAATAGPSRIDAPVVLAARALRCSYGSFEAVRGIDLSVRRGELFALLGTNGAGKTTTLETLEGQRRADGGEVEVFGADPRAERRRLAARIGVVFQDSGLPSELTPSEVLDTWTRLTPDARRHLAVADVLAQVELEHRADVRIGQLSGGERRRLDLALALINDPELVFLDEPTTGLDPEARARTWSLIRDLLRRGTTVVLTTHYLEEAEALADRLAILHEGRIAVTGALAEVVATLPATIRARVPVGTPAPPPLAGDLSVTEEGGLEVRTGSLQSDLSVLLRWADDHDITLHDLAAAEASLAQVFHDIAREGPGRTDPEVAR